MWVSCPVTEPPHPYFSPAQSYQPPGFTASNPPWAWRGLLPTTLNSSLQM